MAQYCFFRGYWSPVYGVLVTLEKPVTVSLDLPWKIAFASSLTWRV